MIKSSQKTQQTETENAILRTLAYAEVFHKPMRNENVYSRMISRKSVSKQRFDQAVDQLVAKREVFYSHNFLALKKDRLLALPQASLLENQIDQRLEDATRAARLFQILPTVKEVYLTGSSATDTPDEHDDLDFFIVTHHNAVWITRFFLVLITTLLGRYAPPVRNFSSANHDKTGLHVEANDKTAGWKGAYQSNRRHAWCINMWSSEKQLTIPISKRSIFTAHEVLLARPLLNAENSLLLYNDWILEYFGNLYNSKQKNESDRNPAARSVVSKIAIAILKKLDHLAFRFQQFYMRKHRTIEVVEQTHAYFHPRDTGSIVLSRYHAILKQRKIRAHP